MSNSFFWFRSYNVTMMKFCYDRGNFFPGCVWTVEEKTEKQAENLFGRVGGTLGLYELSLSYT